MKELHKRAISLRQLGLRIKLEASDADTLGMMLGKLDSDYRGAHAPACIACITAMLLVLAAVTPAFAQQVPEAGRIRIASGAAVVVRAGQDIPAQAGQSVFEGDQLRTGSDGSLGVTFSDDTRLSLGPNTNVNVARYAYAPSDDRFGLVLSVLRGAVAYVSGRLAKLAPDSIRLETPAAIVGVRGTSLAISVESP